MKIRLNLTPEADFEIIKDGDKVVGIELTPVWSSAKGGAVIVYGEAKTDQGEVLERFSLNASGDTGKIVKRTRATKARVTAKIDAPKGGPPPKPPEIKTDAHTTAPGEDPAVITPKKRNDK